MVTGTTASAGDQIIITGCAGAAPIALGERAEELGVAGKLEAGVVERRLGDRIGDDGARRAGLHQADGAFDRLDRRGGEVGTRRAGSRVGAGGERDDRQRAREGRGGLVGRDFGDRRGKPSRRAKSRERDRVGENEEGRGDGVACQPGAQREFGADPGGVAHRHGERRALCDLNHHGSDKVRRLTVGQSCRSRAIRSRRRLLPACAT